MTGFSEEFRRFQTQQRGGGTTVPSTTGSQRQAVAGTENGLVQGGGGSGPSAYPERGARGPAMRHSANDFAWRAQDRAEMKAYRETYQDLGTVAVGATATLDPNVASGFLVRAGGNVTISIAAPEAPPAFDPYADDPQFVVGIKLWVYLPKNAVVTWQGVKFGRDVLDPAGDGSKPSLLAAAADAGWWTFTIVVIPGEVTLGYLASRQA